ncbi:hypothetical protein [Streptosporangium sp. NPDC049644]|uniref:hypothetical protein n=1 Tax=Streptosporangium sp. NPDC049644 TaxID=3155507 RepID=UPI003440E451
MSFIHRTPAAAELLTWPFGVDVSCTDPIEVVRSESGEALETVAGDGTGETFFLYGETASP